MLYPLDPTRAKAVPQLDQQTELTVGPLQACPVSKLDLVRWQP